MGVIAIKRCKGLLETELDVDMATTELSERTSHKLSDKERVFVDQYLVDLDVTKAAIRSGYSVKSAQSIGYQIISRPRVKRAIGHALLEMRVETRLNIDEILEQLQFILFRNVHQFVDMKTGEALGMHQLSPEAAACVDGFEQEVTEYTDLETGKKKKTIKNKLKLVGKAGAIDMAMKYRGLFNKDNEQKQAHVTLDFSKLFQPHVEVDDPVIKAMANLEETASNKVVIEVQPETKKSVIKNEAPKTPIKKSKPTKEQKK